MRHLMRRLRGEDDGAVAVVVGILMVVMLVAVALVVDVGAMQARRAQLQDAADASSLAIAQRCHESAGSTVLAGCDPAVQVEAEELARAISEGTLNDENLESVTVEFGDDPETVEVEDLSSVGVEIVSPQGALFAVVVGEDSRSLHAQARAGWNQPVTALPVAFNVCTLPDTEDTDVAFVATGVYDGVSSLLQSITALLGVLGGSIGLGEYVVNILNCGTNVLAGGWLTDVTGECSYDPNLLTTVTSTLKKVLPIARCTEVVESLVGKTVIVPIYESSTVNLLGNVLGVARVTRFAEIVVTGYDFEGLLGLGSLENYDLFEDPSCSGSVQEFLGVDLGALGSLLDFLLAPLFNELLPTILACQGIQGYVINDDLSAAEATALLDGFRLTD